MEIEPFRSVSPLAYFLAVIDDGEEGNGRDRSDAGHELHRRDPARELQPEGAKRAAHLVLDVTVLDQEGLAVGEQHPQLLANWALDVDRPIPADADHLVSLQEGGHSGSRLWMSDIEAVRYNERIKAISNLMLNLDAASIAGLVYRSVIDHKLDGWTVMWTLGVIALTYVPVQMLGILQPED